MALSMSRPMKHSKTGVYYYRKAVPDDLRTLVGKREWKQSLETKDPAEARRKHAAVAAKVEAEIRELRRRNDALSRPPLRELDDATIKLLGEAYYTFLLEEDEEQRADGFASSKRNPVLLPDDPVAANGIVITNGFKAPTFEAYAASQEQVEGAARHGWARGLTDEFFLTEVDEVLSWEGFEIRLDPASPSRKRVARELQAATIRAAKDIRARNEGDPIATPCYPPRLQTPSLAAHQPLMALFEDWWREAKATGRKPSTYESYGKTIADLIAFLGDDAADKITPKDIVRYKDHRLSSINPRTGKPISAKTVKDSDLAALKAVLGWAVVNHRLPTNAASGITLKPGKPQRLRSKGFTDEEARALLQAADDHLWGRENAKTLAAKRWVPWLCSYTGARVGEIAQLRKQDVRQIDGHHVIHITPEAGTVKTDQARDVVLHPHLIDKRFLEFVASCKGGHLFLDPAPSGEVRGPLRTLKNRLAEFARRTVADPNVMPNHGWRHRFKTLWRDASLDPRVMDAIQGHAPKTVSDSYGDVTIKAQVAGLAKFPRQGN
jgi:integrase